MRDRLMMNEGLHSKRRMAGRRGRICERRRADNGMRTGERKGLVREGGVVIEKI